MNKKRIFYMDELHIPIVILDILKNSWLIILAAITVCIGVFSYSNLVHEPVYTTEVTFAVSPRSNGSYVGFYSSLSTAKEMASVFEEVFSSDVLKRLIREDIQDPELSFAVSASVADGTNILKVSVKTDSPEKAHIVMQSVLRNYRRVSGYLFGGVVLDVLKNPQISVNPVNPVNVKRLMVMGIIMVSLLMMAAIAAISILRPTIKTAESAKRRMEEMPLGILQKERQRKHLFRKRNKKAPLITDGATSFQYTESVLQVSHKIRHKMKKAGMQVILVTSVAENEGKSTFSANLALALAKHGNRVACVDMDLRKPAMHKIFDEFKREDLMTWLNEGIPEDTDMTENLHIFSANRVSGSVDKLLHSKELDALLNSLREKMDFVILDSAPYSLTADAGMLLQHADCCVMIVRQDWVPYGVCRGIADDLGDGNAKFLGYVLNSYRDNGTANSFVGRYGKYGYYGKTRAEE